jgi:inorganic pyrophosphatase
MSETNVDALNDHAYRQAHPWHGVNPTVAAGGLIVYIENTSHTKIKYELDPGSGLLKVDRPQQTSALPPAAYGFVPQTLCGAKVAQLNARLRGDRAALDVFVLSERPIEVPGVLAQVRLIGGIPVRDENYVDDKLVAVLHRDAAFGAIKDISEVPIYMMERICHYLVQESSLNTAEVGDPFGYERAAVLLAAAIEDYHSRFPG